MPYSGSFSHYYVLYYNSYNGEHSIKQQPINVTVQLIAETKVSVTKITNLLKHKLDMKHQPTDVDGTKDCLNRCIVNEKSTHRM